MSSADPRGAGDENEEEIFMHIKRRRQSAMDSNSNSKKDGPTPSSNKQVSKRRNTI